MQIGQTNAEKIVSPKNTKPALAESVAKLSKRSVGLVLPDSDSQHTVANKNSIP